ncbi:hypothetical protein H5410_058896 [Solanum commersonii]|uniref:Uncharacterized protein n=1 Tax=Solanum commersonii TaxID=4109 RepID=A0A9J5W125_SOLCO|nr:hypothetical protein H5410_058896 [Solanum commersonii]
MKFSGEGGSGLCGGQDEGSETEMVWTCTKKVIRQDMAQLDITKDMPPDRKEWRSHIRVEVLAFVSCTVFQLPHYFVVLVSFF